MKRCSVFETEGLVVLQAECTAKEPEEAVGTEGAN